MGDASLLEEIATLKQTILVQSIEIAKLKQTIDELQRRSPDLVLVSERDFAENDAKSLPTTPRNPHSPERRGRTESLKQDLAEGRLRVSSTTSSRKSSVTQTNELILTPYTPDTQKNGFRRASRREKSDDKSDDYRIVDYFSHLPSPPSTDSEFLGDLEAPVLLDSEIKQRSVQPESLQPIKKNTLTSLKNVRIQLISSSQIETNSFLISVVDGQESWVVEKKISEIAELDTKLRTFLSKAQISGLGKPLEKSLFGNSNPSKYEQSKIALELYFEKVLEMFLESECKELLSFFSMNDALVSPIISKSADNSSVSHSMTYFLPKVRETPLSSNSDLNILKEGYLVKKGKGFGGWKSRYFICTPTTLESYEGQNREHIESISFDYSFVLRVNNTSTDPSTSTHSFILTQLKKEAFPLKQNVLPSENLIIARHVFSADSDSERDDWVKLITRQIRETMEKEKNVDTATEDSNKPQNNSQKELDSPIFETPEASTKKNHQRNAISMYQPSDTKSSGTNFVDENMRVLQQKPPLLEPITAFLPTLHFRAKNRSATPSNSPTLTSQGRSASTHFLSNSFMNMRNALTKKKPVAESYTNLSRSSDPSLAIFNASLDHGVVVSRISESLHVPAIVYRCIQYLNHNNAAEEEGIYRLSGSSTAIQHLKIIFNHDGDVDLIAHQSIDPTFDVHTVAGLLKLYLRELTSPVFTKELQPLFTAVTDLEGRDDRISELKRLLDMLPKSNHTVLKLLLAHLISIVKMVDKNKMSVRNLGIIFAPTLGVSSVVFILLLSEYDVLFPDVQVDGEDCTADVVVVVDEVGGDGNLDTPVLETSI